MNHGTHKFEAEGWGSLELEIAESTRGCYGSVDPATVSFEASGFGSGKLERTPFYFFEWQRIQYSYFIEADTEFIPPFRLLVNDRKIAESKQRGNHHLFAGQFVFQDEVGETFLELRDHHNKIIFRLQTEVFPQKMDYQSDYRAMMADISEIIHNLAYDELKTTFRKSKARITGTSTDNEWWNILDALFEQFVIHLGVIKQQPKHEIRKREKVLPVEKIRTASKKNIDWLRKNARYSNDLEKGVRIAEEKYYSHALSSRKYVTYDTYENRFIAWAIREILEKLRIYRKHIEKLAGTKDYSALIRRMQSYQSRLQGILHESPFNEVGPFEKRVHFSTSLTRGAGYRDFMFGYLLLTRGLEVADNALFRISSKQVSTLYEYWCFLKLVQLLKEQHGSTISYQDLVRIQSGRCRVRLEKGQESQIIFRKPDGEETAIYFNRTFKRDNRKIFTYNQKPDYAISFKKNGFEQPFWYLFDAKYRFEDQAEREYNTYNVPEDAIGQLHRYRDAILHSEPAGTSYQKAIKNLGGIILYPYPLSEETFRKNAYYNSIEKVNIGALPFLPSKSGLVSELLNKMINQTSAEEHFERFIDFDRSEYEQQRKTWEDWLSIGVLPAENQAERLHFLNETLCYHIPYVKDLHSRVYATPQWLICRAGSTEADIYDVTGWEFCSKEVLRKRGTTWQHRADHYVVFNLRFVKTIQTPGDLTPTRFRYATAAGLQHYLTHPKTGKNALYITQPTAARLFHELNKNQIPFRLQWAVNIDDSSAVDFHIGDHVVRSSANLPELHYEHSGRSLFLTAILELVRSAD